MALPQRSLTEAEIEQVFNLLELARRTQYEPHNAIGQQSHRNSKRESRHRTWIFNGSEPIKAGRTRHAQLEGVDR